MKQPKLIGIKSDVLGRPIDGYVFNYVIPEYESIAANLLALYEGLYYRAIDNGVHKYIQFMQVSILAKVDDLRKKLMIALNSMQTHYVDEWTITDYHIDQFKEMYEDVKKLIDKAITLKGLV